MQRTIVIGDLHGCFDEALALLDRLAVAENDRVIFAGDLVDRGPKPRACVELAMRHECILGNHEEKHLLSANHHPETRAQLREEHYAYFRTLPKFIRLPEHGAAVVHAGVMPGVAIESQEPYHLLHAQCINPPSKKSYWPSKAPATHTFWTNHWRGPERVIFGHTVVDRPLVTEHAVGIDTGCCFGGPLTAVVLPDWQLVSVPSAQPMDSGRGVKRFRIHGEVSAFS
ncbi:MAG TPA: metallophosphoesterase [Polyangiaceae bacterium]|jgi:diadenosine tetraphosphatase ApaH/serine/threonine PP2A family protein phosphatase